MLQVHPKDSAADDNGSLYVGASERINQVRNFPCPVRVVRCGEECAPDEVDEKASSVIMPNIASSTVMPYAEGRLKCKDGAYQEDPSI